MKVESYVDGDVIAITGPPGVGKSCIVDSILHRLAPAKNIAVLAVDPTSPLSGGALLGDHKIECFRRQIKIGFYLRS